MSRFHASLLLLLAAALWGSTFVVQKLAFVDTGDSGIGVFAYTGARFLLGTLVILPLVLVEARRADAPLRRSHILGFVLCGLMLFAGAALQQIGIIGTSVTNAGFLTGLYVPLVPVLALVLFRRRPHPAIWPAALACIAGLWLLNGGTLDRFSEGDFWVIASAVFWALQVTLVGIFAARSGRPLALAACQFLVTGLLGLSASAIVETPNAAAFHQAGFEILYGGILSVGIAFTLQVVGQRHTSPATAAILLSSEMVFAAIAGVIVLGERLGPTEMAGALLIFGAIVLVELAPLLKRSLPRRAARPGL